MFTFKNEILPVGVELPAGVSAKIAYAEHGGLFACHTAKSPQATLQMLLALAYGVPAEVKDAIAKGADTNAITTCWDWQIKAPKGKPKPTAAWLDNPGQCLTAAQMAIKVAFKQAIKGEVDHQALAQNLAALAGKKPHLVHGGVYFDDWDEGEFCIDQDKGGTLAAWVKKTYSAAFAALPPEVKLPVWESIMGFLAKTAPKSAKTLNWKKPKPGKTPKIVSAALQLPKHLVIKAKICTVLER
ncbi:MAG: hypothetical protein AB7O99_05955 [Dongiaceae bacterium]